MKKKFYVLNDHVAWEIPDWLGERFAAGTYVCPPGWKVTEGLTEDGWKPGQLGALSRVTEGLPL